MDPANIMKADLSQQQILPEWQYSTVSEVFHQPELGKYRTYGIQVMTAHGYTDILHDVSTCKKTADHIVERLNYHRISPIRLCYAVMNMLP